MVGKAVRIGGVSIAVASLGAAERSEPAARNATFPLTGLLVAVVVVTFLGGPVWAASTRGLVSNAVCPCKADPFFSSFLNGQQQLLACTNNTPVNNFVRLVAASIDLIVLF